MKHDTIIFAVIIIADTNPKPPPRKADNETPLTLHSMHSQSYHIFLRLMQKSPVGASSCTHFGSRVNSKI